MLHMIMNGKDKHWWVMWQLEVDNVIKDRCGVVVTRDGGDQVNELNIETTLQGGGTFYESIIVMWYNNIYGIIDHIDL